MSKFKLICSADKNQPGVFLANTSFGCSNVYFPVTPVATQRDHLYHTASEEAIRESFRRAMMDAIDKMEINLVCYEEFKETLEG